VATVVSSPARAVARFGREVVRLAEDGVRRDGPRGIDDIDAATLSDWLDEPVTSVTRLGRTSGTTDRARLALDGPGGRRAVFVKVAAAKPVIRLFGNLASLGENEVGFYRNVRPGLDVEAPQLLGSAFDPRSKRFALVLDDLEAGGATFTDARTPLEVDQTAAVIENLARLHGALWRSPRLGTDLSWILRNQDDPLLPLIRWALGAMAPRIARDEPSLVPPEGRAILDRYPEVVRRLDEGDHTVLHGDPHPGNCYFLDGRAGLLDWQVLRRGNPLRDVAYHMVIGLDPEVRRDAERALLDHYRAALAGCGGPALSAEDAWTSYRRMAAAPYVAAAFTVGLTGLQRDDIAKAGLRRAAEAVLDLDTAGALGIRARSRG
jgi:hypothetical protein